MQLQFLIRSIQSDKEFNNIKNEKFESNLLVGPLRECLGKGFLQKKTSGVHSDRGREASLLTIRQRGEPGEPDRCLVSNHIQNVKPPRAQPAAEQPALRDHEREPDFFPKEEQSILHYGYYEAVRHPIANPNSLTDPRVSN
jgi:hypothetical protein